MNDPDYARLIRRGFLPIVLLVILGAVGGLLVSRSATPLYDSSSAVAFSVAGARTSTDVNQGAMYIQTEMPTYAELATSPAVLGPVVQDLGLKTTPAKLAPTITTTVPQDTAVLSLSVESASPSLARRIADGVASELSRAVVDSAPRLADSTTAVVTTRTIKDAVTPTAPSSPRTSVNVVAGAVIGLLIGALLAIAFEYRRASRTGTGTASGATRAKADSVELPALRTPALTGHPATGPVRTPASSDDTAATAPNTVEGPSEPTIAHPARAADRSGASGRRTPRGVPSTPEDARR